MGQARRACRGVRRQQGAGSVNPANPNLPPSRRASPRARAVRTVSSDSRHAAEGVRPSLSARRWTSGGPARAPGAHAPPLAPGVWNSRVTRREPRSGRGCTRAYAPAIAAVECVPRRAASSSLRRVRMASNSRRAFRTFLTSLMIAHASRSGPTTMAATLTIPSANRKLTPNSSELPVPTAGAAPGKRVNSLAPIGRTRLRIVADHAFQTAPAAKPAPWRPMMLTRE